MEIIISFVIYYTPSVNSYFEECGTYGFRGLHSGMNSINVADIRFLAEGGEILKDYNHVPMPLNEVVNFLNKMPKLGGGKHIFLSKQLYTILYSNS